MLFQRRFLDGILQGTVTVAYRRWRRPTVRAGGTLLTPAGIIAIESVETVDLASITGDEAHRAGFDDRDHLIRTLADGHYLPVYRIKFHFKGADPRVRLRQTAEITPDEEEGIGRRLDILDRGEPWTRRVLQTIREYPGTRSTELGAMLDVGVVVLKTRVRKLKALGLTESLGTGYRISPRGEAWLEKNR